MGVNEADVLGSKEGAMYGTNGKARSGREVDCEGKAGGFAVTFLQYP
jgi:hypothetical protein